MSTTTPRVNILVACFPKSGSTHLRDVLCRVTGFPRVGAVQVYGPNEQDLYKPSLRVLEVTSSVTQQHVKGTSHNVELLKRFGIRPVILVRDVLDALVSLSDHFEREGAETPVGFVHREYQSMPLEQRLHFLVHLHLPWYLHFLMSWREASEQIDTLWTSYEELFADQVGTVGRILSFYGLEHSKEAIRRAIEEIGQGQRFNVGKSGRGRELLSQESQQVARQMAAAWGVDGAIFERIGLRP